jgi:hypothetical protein
MTFPILSFLFSIDLNQFIHLESGSSVFFRNDGTSSLYTVQKSKRRPITWLHNLPTCKTGMTKNGWINKSINEDIFEIRIVWMYVSVFQVLWFILEKKGVESQLQSILTFGTTQCWRFDRFTSVKDALLPIWRGWGTQPFWTEWLREVSPCSGNRTPRFWSPIAQPNHHID